MSNKDDLLRDGTFKGDANGLRERVLFTLFFKANGKERLPDEMQLHRAQKLLSGLVEKLHEQSIITDDEVDDLLLDVLN